MSNQDRLEEARDIIYRTIMVKAGERITRGLAWDRANNATQALMDLLAPPTTGDPGAIPQGNPGDDDNERERR